MNPARREMEIRSMLFFILCRFVDQYKQIIGKGLDARDKLISETISEILKAFKEEK